MDDFIIINDVLHSPITDEAKQEALEWFERIFAKISKSGNTIVVQSRLHEAPKK